MLQAELPGSAWLAPARYARGEGDHGVRGSEGITAREATRQRAGLILRKGADHVIHSVWLRRL